mgnify:FL=1|jgi:glutamine amidotransferase
MTSNIVIIDYGVGNILSIKNAVSFNGFDTIVTSDPEKIKKASHIILPGVGAYPSAIKKLKKMNLFDSIKEAKENNSYILGICLGMQLLFSSSEEFEFTEGLDLIKGDIIKLKSKNKNSNLKLPNIGWRSLEKGFQKQNLSILKDVPSDSKFYFVHSFALENYKEEISVINTKYMNIKFPAVVNFKNIFGCQFHPEKSRLQGLKIIKNFLSL